MKTILIAFALLTSITAHAQLSSTLIDFGNVGYNSRNIRSVSFTNMTSQPLTYLTANVSGQGFTLMNNGCITPMHPGYTCTLTVQLWATQPGNASGNLVVYTNATSSTATLIAQVRPQPAMMTFSAEKGSRARGTVFSHSESASSFADYPEREASYKCQSHAGDECRSGAATRISEWSFENEIQTTPGGPCQIINGSQFCPPDDIEYVSTASARFRCQ